jgi:hypothetical protein
LTNPLTPRSTCRSFNSLLIWHKRGLFFAALCCSFLPRRTPAPSPQQQTPQWRLHERAAVESQTQAQECLKESLQSPRTDRKCNPGELLEKASAEYRQLIPFVVAGSAGDEGAATVADGLVGSGSAAAAIQFLTNRPETAKSPTLSHLLADSLFTIGDYGGAALAYKSWITTGCGGYLNSMHDRSPWLIISKIDRCSQLPLTLRSRLGTC